MLVTTIAALALAAANKGDKPLVKIGLGALRGTWKIATLGMTFGSFEGIPYARPPLGKYRSG